MKPLFLFISIALLHLQVCVNDSVALSLDRWIAFSDKKKKESKFVKLLPYMGTQYLEKPINEWQGV